MKYNASRRKNIQVGASLNIANSVLAIQFRKLELREKKLTTGDTHLGKLRWIKTQYYDLNRTIQDIADDLGVSMMRVRKHLDEIENQETTKNEK